MRGRGHNIGDEDLSTAGIGKRPHSAMETGVIPPIAPFDCSDPGKWEQWKISFDYYLVASNVTDEARKVALFLHMGGSELQELFHAVSDPAVKMTCLTVSCYHVRT